MATQAMITVEVRFFGGVQLFTRRLSPEIERDLPALVLPDGATIDDLLNRLNIPTEEGRPLVSVNRFHRRDNAALADGDHVQLLKTVVGG
jgi:molybdopterin converting factor small subunit